MLDPHVLRQTFSDTAWFSCCFRVGAAQLPGFIAFPWRGNYNALSSPFGFQPMALHLISNFLLFKGMFCLLSQSKRMTATRVAVVYQKPTVCWTLCFTRKISVIFIKILEIRYYYWTLWARKLKLRLKKKPCTLSPKHVDQRWSQALNPDLLA